MKLRKTLFILPNLLTAASLFCGVLAIIRCMAPVTTDADGVAEASWKMVEGHIVTRWAKEVSPANALPEYPRAIVKRERWMNINGLWQHAIRPKDETQRPERFDGRILAPFCVESALSGVKRKIIEMDRIWYRRTFNTPE